MNIKLIVVSKTDVGFVQDGIDEYVRRLKHYCDFSIVTIPALKGVGGCSPAEVKQREGVQILKQLNAVDYTILLDEHGSEYTSMQFASYLQKRQNSGLRSMAFVVGGAFGFSPEVYAAANDKISLSRMTFNHQMVRLFFVEQLYRAHTILRGEKYHNE